MSSAGRAAAGAIRGAWSNSTGSASGDSRAAHSVLHRPGLELLVHGRARAAAAPPRPQRANRGAIHPTRFGLCAMTMPCRNGSKHERWVGRAVCGWRWTHGAWRWHQNLEIASCMARQQARAALPQRDTLLAHWACRWGRSAVSKRQAYRPVGRRARGASRPWL